MTYHHCATHRIALVLSLTAGCGLSQSQPKTRSRAQLKASLEDAPQDYIEGIECMSAKRTAFGSYLGICGVWTPDQLIADVDYMVANKTALDGYAERYLLALSAEDSGFMKFYLNKMHSLWKEYAKSTFDLSDQVIRAVNQGGCELKLADIREELDWSTCELGGKSPHANQ